MRVAVVGAGTAGPAAAILHRRRGDEVVLHERVPTPLLVGAGILLQPTGQRVLAELGLLDAVRARADRIERLHAVNARGARVLDLHYAHLDPALHGLGVQRGALFDVLWRATAAAGVEVRTGVEVTGWEDGPDGVRLRGEGVDPRPFDRLLLCDGARSRLRPPGARVRPYTWGALWFVAAWQGDRATLAQVARDTRGLLGFLPSGEGTVSVFWSLRADRLDAWRARGLEAWKDELRGLAPRVPVDGLRSVDQVIFAPYFDVRLPTLSSGRVAWLGDNAHAMSPQLGQGANLALWDAWEESRAPDLATWAARRRDHVRFYRWASWFLTPFFQSSWPVLAPLRDLGAGLFHAWPWYYRQVLLSLVGVKTGPFGALPRPDWEPPPPR